MCGRDQMLLLPAGGSRAIYVGPAQMQREMRGVEAARKSERASQGYPEALRIGADEDGNKQQV